MARFWAMFDGRGIIWPKTIRVTRRETIDDYNDQYAPDPDDKDWVYPRGSMVRKRGITPRKVEITVVPDVS